MLDRFVLSARGSEAKSVSSFSKRVVLEAADRGDIVVEREDRADTAP
jgi:hypothetical protein